MTTPTTTAKKVIVIGGGFAGLSAASALAQQNHVVTLLEGRQVLGGRAFSFNDPVTGDSVDNGQHLFMGCYQETIKFLSRVDAMEGLTFQPVMNIPFVGAGRFHDTLRCLPLPSPWHLYSGLLRLGTLSWGDRWRLRHVEQELRKDLSLQDLDRLTVDEWLKNCGQSERARRYLWDLITIACLNEDPRIASAYPFVTVLKQAFFGDPRSSQLAFANVGLSELYVKAATRYIEFRGGKVKARSPVHRLIIEHSTVTGVLLRSGEELSADAVISAVPPWALQKMVPQYLLEKDPYFAQLKQLSYAPIISIHLWFDREITDDLFAGLLDTQTQWLFNRSRIHRDPKTKEGYVSLVISGAHAFVDWEDKKILSMVLEELKRLYPKAESAALARSLVIKETHATLSPKVNTERFRPLATSPLKNLYVAGDWTRTGLPATIESACLSGHTCADLINASSPAGVSVPHSSEPHGGGLSPGGKGDGGSIMIDPGLRRGDIKEATHAGH